MALFFEVIKVDDAIEIIRSITPRLERETVPLLESLGRITASDIISSEDIPGFRRSIKDGYAVRSQDIQAASEVSPAILKKLKPTQMGFQNDVRSIGEGECIYIPTGAELPEGADAVVMVEYTEGAGPRIIITKSVKPNENVLLPDEDFRNGETLIRAGTTITPREIGVFAASGVFFVPVTRKPHIGIISTGIELVETTTKPRRGEVRDVNSWVIAAFLTEHGGVPKMYGIVRDNPEEGYSILQQALDECDAVLISGGSSKDTKDITASIITRSGKILAHGLALAPGKPTIIGKCRSKPVIGVPGHPSSTYIVLNVLATPMIAQFSGTKNSRQNTGYGRLKENITSERGREEWFRVALNGEDITPLPGKSGLVRTLMESDGFIRIPQDKEGMESGEDAKVIYW
ncbi:molybdopterin molybdenumtransferase MoeA [Methanocalculus taiwanensis]|uniref:Molybdopterin molybdenumtransferase MoeA n=1 Tax=Methanocalculus taiwanensis TaxID=106207 RepID=A0ABD4TM20_9EURY|nr:gephyrin-like molybdotransferase Glp [Methanocalculus taiwanensis]MCQ1539471.1 molybdopterin molybdenumtransferase MoeA [Methanocalculus taiwanensis]